MRRRVASLPAASAGRRFLATAAAAALVAASPAAARAQQWRVHVGSGAAYNLPLPLAIEQDDEPPLALTARWETRPFATPLYYVVRVERTRAGGAVGLELIHHKLYLTNRPAEVASFAVSHGFNVLTAQRAWELGTRWRGRAGAGVVVTHPETRVRGREQPAGGWLGRGYYLSGPAAQLGAGAGGRLAGALRWEIEGKLVGARAWIPVGGGSARLWHASAHLDVLVAVDL